MSGTSASPRPQILLGAGAAIGCCVRPTFAGVDTLILPAGQVHQLVAETAIESIAAMPLRSLVRTPAGELMELPWRT